VMFPFLESVPPDTFPAGLSIVFLVTIGDRFPTTSEAAIRHLE